MREYLDSTREEEAIFKDVFRPGRRSNTGTSSRKRPLSARHSSFSSDTISDATAETLGKLGSDMDDVIYHLGQLERQLTTLDDKVDYQGRQLRKQLKADQSSKLAAVSRAVTTTLSCKICHLLTRPPATITVCCQQWLGCNACAQNCPDRCPLCNEERPRRVVIRGLDGLKSLKRVVRDSIGSEHVHSRPDDSRSDSDSSLRPLATILGRRPCHAVTGGTAAAATTQTAATQAAADSPGSPVTLF